MKLKRSIIIEGCDNTGKTTLINSLIKEFDEKVEVMTSCRSLPVDEQISWMEKVIQTPKIFDRFALFAESVYGPIIRKDVKFPIVGEKGFFNILNRVIVPKNPIVIICYPGIEAVEKTIEEREQMAGVPSHLKELTEGYNLVGEILDKYTNLPVLKYNYTKPRAYKQLVSDLEFIFGIEEGE